MRSLSSPSLLLHTRSQFALELRFHLVEHVTCHISQNDTIGTGIEISPRGTCRRFPSWPGWEPSHLLPPPSPSLIALTPSSQNLTPLPLPNFCLVPHCSKLRGRGGCQSTPPHFPSSPPSPPSPPTCSLLLPHSLVGRGWRDPPHPSPIPTLPWKQFSKSERVTSHV